MTKEKLEQTAAMDLVAWTEGASGLVYEIENGDVYAVEFSEDGEPTRKYRVQVYLEEV